MNKLHKLPHDFADINYFIDFEASGLHPESYPIEIGIIGGESDVFEALIRPADHWKYWCYDAQDVHRIPRDLLISDGKFVRCVAEALNDRYAGQVLWADQAADNFWNQALFEAAGLEPAFSVGFIYNRIPPDQWAIFQSYRPAQIAHQALQDASDIRTAFLKWVEGYAQVV